MWFLEPESKAFDEVRYPKLTKTFFAPTDSGSIGLRRLLLNSSLPQAELIEAEARRLGLPVVTDFDDLHGRVGDLWVGLRSFPGYRGHEDDRNKMLECDDPELILRWLREAKPAVRRWVIMYRKEFVQDGDGTLGTLETAKLFDSMQKAELFADVHQFSLADRIVEVEVVVE